MQSGKKAKQRITLAFIVNAAGGKEVPIVVGKAASPRCFKGLKDKKNPLGVPYYSNAKAWMNSDIMFDVPTKTNKKLAQQKRNVVLFLDNVSSHPPELSKKFSHIKVIFLPKNTSSRLQPLDAGIIKNFKVQYRKLLVAHTLAQIDGSSLTASEITKSVHILTAIQWMKQAWDAVKEETVVNCFRHCGMQAAVAKTTEDPFADLDENEAQLEDLIEQLHPYDCVTASEYAEADDEVATCAAFEGSENWRQELREMVVSNGHQSKRIDVEDKDEDADDESDEEPPESALTTYTEAIKLGNNMLTFFQSRGEEELADSMFTIIQKMQHAKLKHSQQTSLLDYSTV